MAIKINRRAVPFNNEQNILELAKKNGIDIPSFCYHSELSVYGACRLCMVEIAGRGIQAACSTPPQDGMEIKTHTQEIQSLRKMMLELLLANHNGDCPTCGKSGSCRLQDLAAQLGVRAVRFQNDAKDKGIDASSPSVVRDNSKCILCGDCVRVCQEIQGVGALDFARRGSQTAVVPAFGKPLGEVECVNCGQCVAVCPTGALTAHSQVERVWAAIHDPAKTVVVQIAPAVRVALGEVFKLPPAPA